MYPRALFVLLHGLEVLWYDKFQFLFHWPLTQTPPSYPEVAVSSTCSSTSALLDSSSSSSRQRDIYLFIDGIGTVEVRERTWQETLCHKIMRRGDSSIRVVVDRLLRFYGETLGDEVVQDYLQQNHPMNETTNEVVRKQRRDTLVWTMQYVLDYLVLLAYPESDIRDRRQFPFLFPESEQYRHAQWMTRSLDTIKNCTLFQLLLPGTHDSSASSYQDLAIRTPATSWERFAGRFAESVVGRGLGVKRMIVDLSKSTNLSILQQLQQGVRFFDIRVSYDPDVPEDMEGFRSYYTIHGYGTQRLADVLSDFREFLSAPESKELVVVRLWPKDNLTTESDETLAERAELVRFLYQYLDNFLLMKTSQEISRKVYHPEGTFQDMTRTGSKVLLYFHSLNEVLDYVDPLTWKLRDQPHKSLVRQWNEKMWHYDDWTMYEHFEPHLHRSREYDPSNWKDKMAFVDPFLRGIPYGPSWPSGEFELLPFLGQDHSGGNGPDRLRQYHVVSFTLTPTPMHFLKNLWWGWTGLGKRETLQSLARRMGHAMFFVYLSGMNEIYSHSRPPVSLVQNTQTNAIFTDSIERTPFVDACIELCLARAAFYHHIPAK